MDLKNLSHFVDIVDIGSVQAAARQLGVSRSVLRRGLEELECVMGARLLHRDPSGVRLTAAGAIALERGRPLVESARALLREVQVADQEPRGLLRVILPVGMPLALAVDTLLAGREAMPNQQIVLRHSEDPLADVHQPFELMLHEGPPPDRNHWFSRVLMHISMRPLASAGYLARKGRPMCVEELGDHDILGWQRPGLPAETWPLRAGGSIEVRPWFSSSDPQLLAALAAQGGGIFLAPSLPFFREDSDGALVGVLEDQVGTEFAFRATTPFPARADPRTRNTVAHIMAQLEGLSQV